jgi:hypothetical protein
MITARTAGLWLSVIICATYVLCGQIAGDAYPFSSFAMYARVATGTTRIFAKEANGAIAEVDRYKSWSCSAFTLSDCVKAEDGTVGYRDREALRVVRNNAPATTGGRREPVLLVRRTYRFMPQSETLDCVMAHCTAEPR